jgi:tRNA(adenine34) deaminase
MNQHLHYMNLALAEAKLAYDQDEVPVGAVIVSSEGEILAKAHNIKESANDPCGHAEIISIRAAANQVEDWRLNGAKLYVTLEPCLMCLGAMVHSRIKELYFGAYDKKAGAISLGYKIFSDTRLNHQFSVAGGILHQECSALLSNFFKNKRLGRHN